MSDSKDVKDVAVGKSDSKEVDQTTEASSQLPGSALRFQWIKVAHGTIVTDKGEMTRPPDKYLWVHLSKATIGFPCKLPLDPTLETAYDVAEKARISLVCAQRYEKGISSWGGSSSGVTTCNAVGQLGLTKKPRESKDWSWADLIHPETPLARLVEGNSYNSPLYVVDAVKETTRDPAPFKAMKEARDKQGKDRDRKPSVTEFPIAIDPSKDIKDSKKDDKDQCDVPAVLWVHTDHEHPDVGYPVKVQIAADLRAPVRDCHDLKTVLLPALQNLGALYRVDFWLPDRRVGRDHWSYYGDNQMTPHPGFYGLTTTPFAKMHELCPADAMVRDLLAGNSWKNPLYVVSTAETQVRTQALVAPGASPAPQQAAKAKSSWWSGSSA